MTAKQEQLVLLRDKSSNLIIQHQVISSEITYTKAILNILDWLYTHTQRDTHTRTHTQRRISIVHGHICIYLRRIEWKGLEERKAWEIMQLYLN